MARGLTVQFGGVETRFAFTKLERRKLYGTRRRVAMDRTGAACKRASLTEDGRFLLRRGMTGQGYFTDVGRWVPNGDLVGLQDGAVVERVESTLKTPQILEESSTQALLDCRLTAVYSLTTDAVDPFIVPGGVDFDGNEAKVVLGIAGKDNEHLDMLQKIAVLFSEEENAEQVINASSADEIIALFENEEI